MTLTIDTGVLVMLGLVAYFIPAAIAEERRSPSLHPIIIVNLFLGWTVIGWFAALIWACGKDRRQKVGVAQ